MTVLILSILVLEAFAGSAEIFGHVSDCLVFLFKCFPLLQLLDTRTHVIYSVTCPEINSLTTSQKAPRNTNVTDIWMHRIFSLHNAIYSEKFLQSS